MAIPIVLIHKSDHACLQFSLRAANYHHDEVVLITDIAPDKYSNLAKIVDIGSLENEATKRFSAIYQHLSSNSHAFEYVCFERWFILLEYMKRNQLKEIIYIDSDVIVYENIPAVIQKYYAQYDICLCTQPQTHEEMRWVSSAHTMFCSYDALHQLCEFILDTYTNNMDELLIKWKWHQDNKLSGGVNDMTLLYLFQRATSLRVGNLLKVVDETFCFDAHIGLVFNEYNEQYSQLLGRTIKKISFKNNHPYCYNKIIRKDIRLVCLHFQSDAKRIMPLYIKDKKTVKKVIADTTKILKLIYYMMRKKIS